MFRLANIKKRLVPGIAMALVLLQGVATAQEIHPDEPCATTHVHAMMAQRFPTMATQQQQWQLALQKRIRANRANRTANANDDIVIPLAIHVVWNTNDQKISREKIVNAIAQLNNAFNANDPDFFTRTPQAFVSYQADVGLSFCLGQYFDEQGKLVEAITYTKTFKSAFNSVDPLQPLKTTELGGHDPINPAEYLNIWIAPLKDDVAGFSTFPGHWFPWQGVTVKPQTFQLVQNDQVGLAKTLIHEIGHYLFLKHTWGDKYCGNDFVEDTPPAQGNLQGLLDPVNDFPFNQGTCSNDPKGEMFCNYMTYFHDSNRTMFTLGQREVMRAMFEQGGPRETLLFSNACEKPARLMANCCSRIERLQVSALGETGAKLNWPHQEAATGYEVRYRPVWIKLWSPAFDTNVNEYSFTDFPPEKSYLCQVRPVCSDGTKGPWASAGFSTGNKCAQNAPELAFTATKNSVTVTWPNVTGVDFKEVLIRKVIGDDEDPQTPFFDAERIVTSNSFTFSALEQGTRYRIDVNWKCLGGRNTQKGSTLKNYIIAQTAGCPDLANPSVDATTKSSVTLRTTQKHPRHEFLNGAYRKVGETAWSAERNANSAQFITFFGLEAGTDYEFRVRAKCSTGDFSSYDFLVASTLAAAQAIPEEEVSLSLYPNPATTSQPITIDQTTGPPAAFNTLQVVNSQGDVIYNKQLEGGRAIKLVLGRLAPGLYMIVLRSGAKTTTKRLLITK